MSKCDHDFVFLIACGAMACIACAHHTSLENYTALREQSRVKAYNHHDCQCGWAEATEENNDG